MARTTRHSKRQRQKQKRRAKRRENRRHGQKAGSIAIHSLLPGLEGAELGSMDVVIDTRRSDQHPALINVAIHSRSEQRAIIWSIETGFGGQAPRVGYQVIADRAVEEAAPTWWLGRVDEVDCGSGDGEVLDVADVVEASSRPTSTQNRH